MPRSKDMADPLTIIHSDALSSLRDLDSESVQCCVTSPPYWNLRDYGHEFQIGLENTPEEYIAQLVQVFAEVRRVLRKDGTMWLNIGDSYAGSGCGWGGGSISERGNQHAHVHGEGRPRQSKDQTPPPGCKPKDLVGIPWMVALALRGDGWYLRSEITWCKRAPMPESVRDRPTCATEKIFLFSKAERYLYNSESVRYEPLKETSERALRGVSDGHKNVNGAPGQPPHSISQPRANRRPFGSTLDGGLYGRHHLGEAIPEKQRRSDKQRGHSRRHAGFNDRWDLMSKDEQLAGGANLRNYWILSPDPFPEAHFATFPREIPRRCILLGSSAGDVVLDPFAGSGTTGKVAIELGRRAILIEPKAEYVEMIKKRCQTTIGLPLAI